MKGLELAREYYETFGKPMLEKEFPHLLPFIAAGLFGSGSECFGYDDGISQDHDFEPGFCILLPGEDIVSRRDAFLLERAYAKLPMEFMGFKRSRLSPVGGNRHGVMRTAEVFLEKTGTPDGSLTADMWLRLPEQALYEAVNGEIFYDGYGEVSAVRKKLEYYPEDIRRKKLAGHLLLMAQAGQYNYPRLISRGEKAAAQMAVFEFVKSAMNAVFLLNRRYMPYYKWGFRAMRDLAELAELSLPFETLITSGNDKDPAEEKCALIEKIAEDTAALLQKQQIIKASGTPKRELRKVISIQDWQVELPERPDETQQSGTDLERLAFFVNDSITDASVRNLHILEGV